MFEYADPRLGLEGQQDFLDQEMVHGEVTLSEQMDKDEVTREILVKITEEIESVVRYNVVDDSHAPDLTELLYDKVESFRPNQSLFEE